MFGFVPVLDGPLSPCGSSFIADHGNSARKCKRRRLKKAEKEKKRLLWRALKPGFNSAG
jgi:hypothetical protein